MAARHAEWSAISSADDLYVRPNDDLVGILLGAAEVARTFDLVDVAQRCATEQEAAWIRQWPGEHYRLLAALAQTVGARTAVEVGTYQGPGSLSLLAGMGVGGRVITYDVISWRDIDGCILTEADFAAGLEQRLGDLSEPAFLESQIDMLREAELIFVDGPKDGIFEPKFCAQVLPLLEDRRRLVVFDDIGRLNMLQLWRDLPYPKLDATSLGHWSGTGLMSTQ